jgi:hypothetical protein
VWVVCLWDGVAGRRTGLSDGAFPFRGQAVPDLKGHLTFLTKAKVVQESASVKLYVYSCVPVKNVDLMFRFTKDIISSIALCNKHHKTLLENFLAGIHAHPPHIAQFLRKITGDIKTERQLDTQHAQSFALSNKLRDKLRHA